MVLLYINKMKTILWGHGQLFEVLEFVCFSLDFVILVLHYINNMKTILAGNANAFLKNQINNMERKIYTVQLRFFRTTHTRIIRSYFAYTRMSIRVYAYVNTRVYVPLLCIPISFFV